MSILADALKGLPPEWRSNLRSQFAAAYDRVPSSIITREEYISFFLANSDAVRQKRAAISLADIGTPGALDELRNALREDSLGHRSYRYDALKTIRTVLAFAEEGPFDGEIARSVAFLDTVTVREGSLAFDGDESVFLHGGYWPDDLLVTRWSDSLSFVAVGENGSYAVSVTNLDPSGLSQVDSLVIYSFRYGLNRIGTAENLALGPLPRRIYLVLAGGDSVDTYRFQPDLNVDVTAIADWPGPAQVTLAFDTCSIFQSSPGEISGTVVDQNGDPLSGVTVTAPSVPASTTTGDRGGFRLTGPPAGVFQLEFAKTGYVLTRRLASVGSGGRIVTLLPSPAHTLQVSNPDTVRVSVPNHACYMIRPHRLDFAPEPAIVRLRVDAPIPDNAGPQIAAITAPSATATSDPDILLKFSGTIQDRNIINRAEARLFVDGTDPNGTGADGTCDLNPVSPDHLLLVPAEVDRNNVEVHNGSNSLYYEVSFTVHRPQSPVNPITYCFAVLAEDNARDSSGAPDPNSSIRGARTAVSWN